jgi:CheY-like chemotaxis protein/anti-sigma regulatory factor (Ser/Thr protein kinase)
METVGRLAAGVAHDFNNQLTVILGYADMFLSEGRKDDPLWEPMTQIRQAARRAHSTTSHLLSFSRKQILAAELVDLREFLKETEMPVSRMLGEDIRLIVAVDPDCPPVFVDKSGLHQAIMNIVVNARDAMPNGGELVLQASRFNLASANATEFAEAAPGTYVLLEVIDTGAGMDGQTLEHAFEPFFTTKEQGKGTGLGLPMVMGFVGQSHGFVGIKSEPGKGTIVRLLFPPAEDKVADDHEPPVSPPVDMHKDKTIAVIEDEEGVRLFLVNALKQSGYRVLAAAGPGECLKLLKDYNGPLDLVISDMIMPEMRGDELARRLKASSPELPVLFITGYAEQCSLAEGELLRKPFDVDDLLARVQSLTSKRAVGENETQA